MQVGIGLERQPERLVDPPRRLLRAAHGARDDHLQPGVALFGDAFGPEHLIPLWYAGHANTGITVFERRNRRMDGMDFDGWHLMSWNDRAHV